MAAYTIRDGNPHSKPVVDIKWNTNGEYLGSVSFDKSFKVGQMDNNGNYRTVHNNIPGIAANQLCWQPDSATSCAISGDDRMIEVFDIRVPRPSSRWLSLGSNINMAWSRDGHYLVVGNKSDHLLILDARTGKQLKKQKYSCEINEMCWSYGSDHLLIATGGMDSGGIDILHFVPPQDAAAADLKLLQSLTSHTSSCYCMKSLFSPRGSKLVTGSADMVVAVWDLATLCVTTTISTLESAVRSLSIRGDGEAIALAAETPSVAIHCATSSKLLTSVELRAPLLALAYHPTANVLAVAPDERGGGNDDSKYMKLVHFSDKL